MKMASISTTKNQLSALLEQVRSGETVVITDHSRPIAKLERITASSPSVDALLREGLITPPRRKHDVAALLKLRRASAPGANLVKAVEEDRDSR